MSSTNETTVVDLETRMSADHHQAIKLWLRLLTCTNLISAEVRSRLRAEFEITLARFDLLAQLERVPEGLRMGELSRRLMVTSGNVTGLTDPLERDGLVVREVDPQDRRSFMVRLTEAGRESFLRMARVHESWVIEIFSGLSSAKKNELFALLGKLKEVLNQGAKAAASREERG